MKKIIIILCIFHLSAKAQIPIYNFTLADSYGNTHDLYSYLTTGNAVILDFFMVSCANCTQFAPELEIIYQNFGANTSTVKVLTMEVSDTASNSSINLWKLNYGSTYPSIGGHDAYSYWNNYFKPTLGGTVNQIVAIIPNTGNPMNSYLPYIEIGIMDTSKIQNLYDELANYGYHVNINENNSTPVNVSIFPNPAKEFLNLSIDIARINDNKISWYISDISGKYLFGSSFIPSVIKQASLQIALSGLQNGLYIFHIQTDGYINYKKFTVLQ